MSKHYRKDPQALNALTEMQFNVTQKKCHRTSVYRRVR